MGGDANLAKRVPLAAVRTFANPFGCLLSAVGADVCYFFFCHREGEIID